MKKVYKSLQAFVSGYKWTGCNIYVRHNRKRATHNEIKLIDK